jgi:hypothetical protein
VLYGLINIVMRCESVFVMTSKNIYTNWKDIFGCLLLYYRTMNNYGRYITPTAMKIYIPWLSTILLIVIFSSCRNDNATPIRNVRFDPGLLNPVKAGGGPSCVSHSYYYNGQSKALGTIYSRMILVAFDDSYTYEQAVAAAEQHGFVEGVGQAVQTNTARLYPLKLVEGLSCKQVEVALIEIARDPAVSYAAPYFMADRQLLGISNEFIVTVEDRQHGGAILERLANATRTTIVTSLNDDTYVLRADKGSRGNALEMANFFQEQPFVKHAEPDFVVSLEM